MLLQPYKGLTFCRMEKPCVSKGLSGDFRITPKTGSKLPKHLEKGRLVLAFPQTYLESP